MRWIGVIVAGLACSDPGGAGGVIRIGDFCGELNRAGCDVGQRCMTAPADRAACLAFVEDTWDACPPAQQAVAFGESSYDPEAARVLVERTRDAPCGGSPVPDWVNDVAVFTPQLVAGARCQSDRSKVSCLDGECEEGFCVRTPPAWPEDAGMGMGSGGCVYDGTNHVAGETFLSRDGCNRCNCQSGGAVICTEGPCLDGGGA